MSSKTHGEFWYIHKQNLSVRDKKNSSIAGMPNRMGYKDGIKYYKKKFARYFEQQVTIKDFKSAEDYFGYFEALKIRDIIEKIQ